jgi:hypothetical protein
MTFFEWFRAALLLILLCEDRHEFLTALRWIRDLRREMSAFNETRRKLEDPRGRYDHAGSMTRPDKPAPFRFAENDVETFPLPVVQSGLMFENTDCES